MWEGEWITVFRGSTCRTFVHLQDRLAVMSPLETDLRSVCCVFLSLFFSSSLFGILGANWKLILDLCLNSIWTQHITPCGGDRGGLRRANNWRVMTDWKNDTQSGRQADRRRGRTEGRREGQSIARRGLLSWRHREAKVQSGRSRSIHMVSLFGAVSHHVDSV